MAKATTTKVTVVKTVEVEEDVVNLELSPEEAQILRNLLGAFYLRGVLSPLDSVWRELAEHSLFSQAISVEVVSEIENQYGNE